MATAQQPLNSSPEVLALTSVPPKAELLAMSRAPEIVLEEAAKAARALREIIEAKPRKVVLNGKTYLQFEDWQILGRFYGVTAVACDTNPVNFGKVQGFESHAEALLVSSNQVISSAEAMCLDDEANWNAKPLYQLRSMAQTRACAKALRNVLAWVVVLAGYAPTPAEEMDNAKAVNVLPSAGSIPENVITARCTAMANAADLEILKRLFATAYREADAAKDRRAMTSYIQIKDARKKELR